MHHQRWLNVKSVNIKFQYWLMSKQCVFLVSDRKMGKHFFSFITILINNFLYVSLVLKVQKKKEKFWTQYHLVFIKLVQNNPSKLWTDAYWVWYNRMGTKEWIFNHSIIASILQKGDSDENIQCLEFENFSNKFCTVKKKK